MRILLIHFAIYFSFYIIGAYATTDILRLLKGCAVSINATDCYCPVCNKKIALKDQIPIFSYIKNKGTCFHCGSPIPVSDLFLELFLFATLSVISSALNFSWTAYILCVVFYEITKVLFLLFYGHREKDFMKNLFRSIFNNFFLFSLIAFLFLISQIA